MNIISKDRIFQIIEKAEDGDKQSKIFDVFILTLILMNILAIILESHSQLYSRFNNKFRYFEVFSIVIFTIEYLLRIWTASIKYKGLNISNANMLIKHIKSPLAIVDLLAVLPFYIPMIIPIDLRFLRLLRIARFLRIFKLNRYSKALVLISTVIGKKKDVLVATGFIMGFIVLLSSILMFYVENPIQPDVFTSITATLWWSIATLTTIGYGDIYPITILGKILAAIIAIAGIGIVALPTGIISSGFMEEINQTQLVDNICPYCGKNINIVSK